MKNDEDNEWLTTKCFKLAADKDAPIGVRVMGPLLGVGMAVTEPIARLCFWWDEKHNG